MNAEIFPDKAAARQAIWDRMQAQGVARFPYPPHGRIPNFANAAAAAERLFAHPVTGGVRRMKVNPDAGQRPVRELALRRGIELYMPTPRLKGGFRRFDPASIPEDRVREAASLSKGASWGEGVALDALPPMELVVTGSVAVTPSGRRCGKGHGYGDIEYAILRELGYLPVPVVTTVHETQIVADFPADPHDLPVSLIVTPERTLDVPDPPPAPTGIDWSALPADALEAMPVLGELLKGASHK